MEQRLALLRFTLQQVTIHQPCHPWACLQHRAPHLQGRTTTPGISRAPRRRLACLVRQHLITQVCCQTYRPFISMRHAVSGKAEASLQQLTAGPHALAPAV